MLILINLISMDEAVFIKLAVNKSILFFYLLFFKYLLTLKFILEKNL